FLSAPLSGNDFRHWKTVLGIIDCRFQQTFHRKFPVAFVQLKPSCYGRGDGDRMHSSKRYAVEPTRAEEFDRRLRTSPPAAVQPNRFTILLHIKQGKYISTDTGHHGFHYIENGGRRNCGVNSRSAILQPTQC